MENCYGRDYLDFAFMADGHLISSRETEQTKIQNWGHCTSARVFTMYPAKYNQEGPH